MCSFDARSKGQPWPLPLVDVWSREAGSTGQVERVSAERSVLNIQNVPISYLGAFLVASPGPPRASAVGATVPRPVAISHCHQISRVFHVHCTWMKRIKAHWISPAGSLSPGSRPGRTATGARLTPRTFFPYDLRIFSSGTALPPSRLPSINRLAPLRKSREIHKIAEWCHSVIIGFPDRPYPRL